jgi:SAM-dependent methyltransferase
MESNPDHSGDAFDACADDYDGALNQGLAVSGESKEFFAEARIQWTSDTMARMEFSAEAIMDFGCGVGTATPYLSSTFSPKRIVGVDTSHASLKQATHQFGREDVCFMAPDACSLENEVDLVYSNGTFHHIPLDARASALGVIHRALRPGGLFALWENNPWNIGTRWVMSRIPFDRDAVTLSPPYTKALLASHGFSIVRTDFLFLFPACLRALRPLERCVSRLPLGAQYMTLARKVEPADV